MFLDCDWVVCSALKCKVVGDDHALYAPNHTDSCNHVGTGHALFNSKRIVTCKLSNLEERSARVENAIDSLTWQQLFSLLRYFSLLLPDVNCFGDDVIQLLIQPDHLFIVRQIVRALCIHFCAYDFHVGLF